ncbi:hypothetical protein FFB58_10465 [Enterobacter sp. MF024]|uniref:hypothetical protein n=1 Tax=Enterobacter sp. MF024 TaxID=2555644 RepID=UPI0011059CDD|nr:hypothetical protein [Enterobacter sp. MF024]TLU68304.1 hypothetical protein FFB58_10465 [Enterobacter sp. MF024]
MASNTITFRIPSDLTDSLKAAASGTSNTAVIVDALRAYLKQPYNSAEARLDTLVGKLEAAATLLNSSSVAKNQKRVETTKAAFYDAEVITGIVQDMTAKAKDRKVNVAIANRLNELGYTTSKGGKWGRADVNNFKLRVMAKT